MIAVNERDSLTDRVTAIVRRSAKIPGKVAIGPESRLVEDLAIDSLDLVSVVLQVQDHFDVVFDEDAVPNLCRVADIVEYLAVSMEVVACKGGLYGDGVVRNSGPYGDGEVRNSGPYGDGVVRKSGPYGDGEVRKSGPYGDGEVRNSGPYGRDGGGRTEGVVRSGGPYGRDGGGRTEGVVRSGGIGEARKCGPDGSRGLGEME